MSAVLNEPQYTSQYASEPYEQGKNLADYMGILRRRRGLILLVAIVIFIISAIIAISLPRMYRSTATILIQEQEIPQDLVRSTITSYADERLQVISQQVMTRAVLLNLVEQYSLYASKRSYETNEEILDRMRADIKLTPVSADVTDRRTGSQIKSTIAFTLAYESDSPTNAQKIANELTTLYLNENLKNRQQKAAETSSFLQEEAERLNKHISEVEQKLSDFKSKNQGKLPELAAINLASSDRTDSELMRIEHDLTALEDRRIMLESQLAQVKPANPIVASTGDHIIQDPEDRLKSLQAQLAGMTGVYTEDHPDIKHMRREIASLKTELGEDDATGTINTDARLAEMEASLSVLKQKYSDTHPDVIKAERAIAALKQSQAKGGMNVTAAAAGSSAASSFVSSSSSSSSSSRKKEKKPDNPTYITLKSQLDSTTAEMQSTRAMRNDLRAKMNQLESRMLSAPEVEREYLELTRDQENSRMRYREVREKQAQAEVAQQLEHDSKAERFSLIDPPQFPERAFKPNRMAILLLGLVVALLGGLATAGLREALDRTVRSGKDVVRILRVPVLSIIPALENPRQMSRRSSRTRWVIAAGIGAVLVVLVLVNFLYMPLEVIWYGLLRRLPI